MEVGEEINYIYLSIHYHHQNNTCIKTGSDESHFNVSLIVRDKATRQCPQTTAFEENGESKRIRTEVFLLTGLTARPNRHPQYTKCKLVRHKLLNPTPMFMAFLPLNHKPPTSGEQRRKLFKGHYSDTVPEQATHCFWLSDKNELT